jgi:hypothetical protein
MKRSLILTSAVAVALAVGGCASSSKKTDTANASTETAKNERPWWKLPKSWKKKPSWKPWVYGDVRQGKGLLSDDEDGFVVYSKPTRGSSDPSKPEKLRR